MYVYIWKDTHSIPFYVGFTKNKRRTNPQNNGGRNWLTKQKLTEVGADRIIVELRPVASIEEGVALECALIKEFGRVQTGDGPLTNLTSGGEGTHTPSPAHKEKLRIKMLDPSHPIYSAETRAKIKVRMNSPDVKAKLLGDANVAKRPEVRAKLKAIWQDEAYRTAQIASHTGRKRVLQESTKETLRKNLAANPAMKDWSERNGKDAEFDAKRIAGIRAAQPKRAEKMTDPVALAQRKARLSATLNSPEYKAKRALWDTPEHRQKLSSAKRAYWEQKKLEKTICLPQK
jgi:hypothetical protein